MSTKKETVNVGEELRAEAEKRYPKNQSELMDFRYEAFIKGGNFALSQRDEEMEELKKILSLDEPWPLNDVLNRLIKATEILLIEKNYDGHGYEEMNACVVRAKETIEQIEQFLNRKTVG